MASDYDRLVSRITSVLSSNPALVGTATASSSTGSCDSTDCTSCGECATQRPDAVRSLLSQTHGGRVSGALGAGSPPADVAGMIDHTLLKPDATYDMIDELCDEAIKWGFKSVCVNPWHVKRAAKRLRGQKPVVCTVIGFPLGATPSQVKAMEARQALRDGATELDMVINIGALKSGDDKSVYEDIRMLAEIVHGRRALLKVIIESCLLTDEEKIRACVLSKKARADFVKTSTGFSKGGATAHDIALMSAAVERKLGVKASGGVRSGDDAKAMIAAGATRIGASVGIKITEEYRTGRSSQSSSGGGY